MKVTITIEADDGSTQTSTYPNVTEAKMSTTPIYAGGDSHAVMRGCWVSTTLKAAVDDNGVFVYVTTGDPE